MCYRWYRHVCLLKTRSRGRILEETGSEFVKVRHRAELADKVHLEMAVLESAEKGEDKEDKLLFAKEPDLEDS